MKPITENRQYILGNDSSILNHLATRTLRREASFLIPYLKNSISILDIGCGTGSITLDISEYIPNSTVIGIDIDDVQINILNSKDLSNHNVKFYRQDVYALNFEDNEFDLVFIHTVLMHLENPRVALREVFRVCKPGGKILLREGAGTIEYFKDITIGVEKYSLNEFINKSLLSAGGNPNVGLLLKDLAYSVGFEDILYGVESTCYQEKNELYELKEWYQAMVTGHLGNVALNNAIVTSDDLLHLSQSLDMLPYTNSALSIVVWAELIANKPI